MVWEVLLSEIQKIEERYGSSLRKPAKIQEITRMKQEFERKFNHFVVTDRYIGFLQKVNGLDFNGLVLYGVDSEWLDRESDDEIQGFIETNELWYENEWQQRYVFFGDSDLSWYCYDRSNQVFVELDKPSGSVMKPYSNFDDMLESALKTRLL